MATRRQENVTLALAVIGLLIILSAAMYSRSASGATPTDMRSLVQKAKSVGVYQRMMVGDVLTDEWQWAVPKCGNHAEIRVGSAVDNSTPLGIMAMLLIDLKGSGTVAFSMAEGNGDGLIDAVGAAAIGKETLMIAPTITNDPKDLRQAQSVFDDIVKCALGS